jgi:fluoride exporter
MSVLLWAGVLVIGGLGAVTRFLVDGAVGSRLGRDFPFGTLVINISGAAVLGLLTGLGVGSDEALLAGTAAVGSYTTFSTWMFETQRLAEERELRAATTNIIVSLAVGIAAAAAGRAIGARL